MSLFCCLVRESAASGDGRALDAIARACSPGVAQYGSGAVMFDVSGLDRAIGPPAVIAAEIERLLGARGVRARLAIAGTKTAAWVLAQARQGTTVVSAQDQARVLAEVGLSVLGALPDPGTGHQAPGTRTARLMPGAECLAILSRWGLRTLGDLAKLPEADVRMRLGADGVRLHRAARGQDDEPLVPEVEPTPFLERLDLEWPIEGLEPLSFVLARLCDALSASLDRADRGAVTVTTRLRLVTRETHERVLHLPAPMRDARVLRTLILLDLESHPPPAAIDIVELRLEVTPASILQGSLLTRALPSPETLATLVARLCALMGEGRVGAPRVVDTHDERAAGMTEFAPRDQGKRQKTKDKSADGVAGSELLSSVFCLFPLIRRFRLPIPARVSLERGAPVIVTPSVRGWPGGRVVACAGPWRSSGRWWAPDAGRWDIDGWDIELPDGVYRVTRDRRTNHWEIEGAFD